MSVGLGALLSQQSDAAALAFLGEEALLTLQGGEIWTDWVVKEAPAPVLAAAIALNNSMVGLAAWASGVLLGLGSAYVVVSNGLMVGALFGTAARYGVFERLIAFTAAHGPLELTLIVVCAGAGLSFARQAMRDDGRPLAQRTTDAARDSLLLYLGTVPGFGLLGIVEGFISPDMAIPTSAKAALGALLLLLFGVYVRFGGASSGAERAPSKP